MLEIAKRDGVARVTLNRPELRNAFDDALIASLKKAFLEIGNDSSVRVLVLAQGSVIAPFIYTLF